MKGRLGADKWAVFDMGLGSYLAERYVNGKYESHEARAHCLACVKAEILMEYGGKVDLRGWHKQGVCGSFLLAVASGE